MADSYLSLKNKSSEKFPILLFWKRKTQHYFMFQSSRTKCTKSGQYNEWIITKKDSLHCFEEFDFPMW